MRINDGDVSVCVGSLERSLCKVTGCYGTPKVK